MEKKESKIKKFFASKPVKIGIEVIKDVALIFDTFFIGGCIISAITENSKPDSVESKEMEVTPTNTETVNP